MQTIETYTVARNDGDKRRRGLSRAEAAAYICELQGWPNDGRDDDTFRANMKLPMPSQVETDAAYDAAMAALEADEDQA